MMKKIWIVIFSIFLIFSFSSCEFNFGNNNSTQTEENNNNEYNITFYAYGLTKDPETIKGVKKIPDELPTVSATGYFFQGWYYDSKFSRIAKSGDKLESNVTLYALFVLNGIEEPTKTPVEPGDVNIDTLTSVKVNILQMNDIHGHIEQDASNRNGISNAAYKIDSIRKEDSYDNTLLVGNGDMFQETAISRLSYGRVVIDCMNEMGFDFIGIGNHEFDWGIDKILAYFDGDKSNGEANFPLINSNIYYNNKLVLGDNIYESMIIEKQHVKIGVISLIGNVMGSINANMTVGYSFKAQSYEMEAIVSSLGKNLRNNGADIIVVNIHDGNADGIDLYEPNNILADLKYNDKYLVDVIINGHTHTRQSETRTRQGGSPIAIIQSGGSLKNFGRIDLEYDLINKEIKSATATHVYLNSISGSNSKVEAIVDDYYNQSKNIIEEVYCDNKAEISRYDDDLFKYAANLMMASTGADAAIGNFGGFRNSITSNKLDFNGVYALNPFDNHIILCKIKGSDLKKFADANASHNYCYTIDGNFVTDKTYTLAIIDYVYFSYYFRSYRTNEYIDTLLEVRNIMIEDLRLRDSFNINTDYKNVLIGKLYE